MVRATRAGAPSGLSSAQGIGARRSMMGLRRSRWMTLFLGTSAVVGTLIAASPAWASGGGGCGQPVTDARGVSVSIRMFCFTPTVLHIRAGQDVTWRNTDPFPHNVIGANAAWGSYDLLRQG